MQTSLISGLLFALLSASPSFAAHHSSPCPDIFQYEGPEPENNRWFGEVSLRTEESLVGIRLDIELDRPSELMVSWMGDLTTSDNMKYTVLNLNQRLKPGPPVLSRIMVKFNRTVGSPKLQIIRLNGRQICPEDAGGPSQYEESSRPQKPQSTRRPDPEFGDNYGETVDEYPVNGNLNNNDERPRPTSQSNNNNNNRPSAQSNNNRPNSNNSPNTDSLNSSNNRPGYKPTTTTEEPYTTRRNSKITTTQRVPNDNNSNRPNSNSNNPNTVSLQASSTDSNSEINGVINGLLQSNQNKNKTVIITVIENNNNQEQQNNNRPNNGNSGGSGGNRPVSTENSSQSRPNSNNRPTEQQTTSNSQNRPNSNNRPAEQQNPSPNPNKLNISNQGSGSISSNTLNSQQPSNSAVSCGEVKLAVPLVTSGQSTHRGQWPWHVALYLIEGINLSYHCGGSLVSKNKIITAAHCVTTKQNDGVINSTKLVIYLGKYHQLHYSDELGIQTKQVTRISVYPSYNSSNYLGDIAVLTLSSDAEFTNYVMPVCLWDEKSDNLNDIVGKEGTVVGWGFDENDTPTEELKMAKMPVVSHQTCIWSYPQFFSEFTSDKTFCAGFRNGTSVCNGDSGGGMVFNKNNRWYLRGIVSVTVAKEGLRVCDTRHYVVFTDVAKYVDFVRNNLRR